MSLGGDGFSEIKPLIEVARPTSENLKFIPRRFRAGGRLRIDDHPKIQTTSYPTCVLCGGLIVDEPANYEHALPQWLHRLAGNSGEIKASTFSIAGKCEPTWRQLCLYSHEKCNEIFGKRIEAPAKSIFNRIIRGQRVTWTDIDLIFDWLDKIKSASAHMSMALRGNDLLLDYNSGIAFPLIRIGLFDRVGFFFRLKYKKDYLDLIECLEEAFVTTPSAIMIVVNDLVIVYASNNCLLSEAFGLGSARVVDGDLQFVPGTGLFAGGFVTRVSRLPFAKILAQPMRRQHTKEGLESRSPSLQDNGDGYVYELSNNRWNKLRSLDFSELKEIHNPFGLISASIETVEWNILAKEQDNNRYLGTEKFFMRSMPYLVSQKIQLENMLDMFTGLIPIKFN